MLFEQGSGFHQLFEDFYQDQGQRASLCSPIKKERKKYFFKKWNQKTQMHNMRWNIFEDQKYIQFLEKKRDLFIDQRTKRENKTFKLMSIYLEQTRSAEQCRGHHKKKIKKYHTIDQIICQVKKQIEKGKNSHQSGEEQLLKSQISPNTQSNQLLDQQKVQDILPDSVEQRNDVERNQMMPINSWSSYINL